jgi:hypothetical protein
MSSTVATVQVAVCGAWNARGVLTPQRPPISRSGAGR